MSVLNIGQAAGNGVIDTEDAIIAPIFVLAGAAMSGVAVVDILGYEFTATAYTFQGYAISYAFIIAAASLALVWFTNQPDLSKMDDEYTYLTVGMGVLLIAQEFVPAVNDPIVGSDPLGIVVMIVYAGGFYAVAYLG